MRVNGRLPRYILEVRCPTPGRLLKNLKMAYVCAAEVTSRIKGHHAYNYQCEIGEELVCFRERRNRSSENAIVVQKALGESECKKKKKKKRKRLLWVTYQKPLARCCHH